MVRSERIATAELERMLDDALRDALRSSGWEVARAEREYALGGEVRVDLVAWLTSGLSEIVLVVDVQAHARPGRVRERLALLRRLLSEARLGPHTALAFFVPRITGPLATLLREREVGYFDLAGSCCLRWPGMYIDRPAASDPPPSDTPSVRPDSVFSPGATKKHRVLRAMLSYPRRRWHQVKLAAEAQVSAYTAHRTVACLLADHHADYEGRGPDKVVFLVEPGQLLDAWNSFWRGTWRMNQSQAGLYYCLGRNVDDVRARIARAATDVGGSVGFTLTAGANRYGAYLRDELVHAYFTGAEAELAEAADLDAVPRGANVFLYAARDEGVFYVPAELEKRLGLGEPASIRPVCPVQLYLDMKAAGGRYAEQADELRREVLGY